MEKPRTPPAKPAVSSRKDRLAAALKANLLRRKAAAPPRRKEGA
jgi:hypothetical protein